VGRHLARSQVRERGRPSNQGGREEIEESTVQDLRRAVATGKSKGKDERL